MARWGLRAGRWYMIQWTLDGTVSLGVHVDPLRRSGDHGPFGPYVDVHLGPVVVSVGNHPDRAGDYAKLASTAIMRPG